MSEHLGHCARVLVERKIAAELKDLEAERGGFFARKERRSDEVALSPQLAVLLAVRVNLSAGKIADAFPDSIK